MPFSPLRNLKHIVSPARRRRRWERRLAQGGLGTVGTMTPVNTEFTGAVVEGDELAS